MRENNVGSGKGFEVKHLTLLLLVVFLSSVFHALNVSCAADSFGHVTVNIADEKKDSANVVIVLKRGNVNVAGVSKHNLALPYIWKYTVDEVGNYTCTVIDMDEGKLYQQTFTITLPKKMQKIEKEKKEQQSNLAILIVIVGFVLVIILTLWLFFGKSEEKEKNT